MKYSLAQGCQYHQINGEPCLLNKEGDFASFNETGRLIISSVCGEMRLDAVTHSLQTTYGLREDELEEDVRSFLHHLVENGFLTTSSYE